MKDVDRSTGTGASKTIKQCCAQLYESDLARWLLGNSFHPGGLPLTERLGTLLALTPETRVLDVASGTGTSAVFLAERFGCQVVGVDYSSQSVDMANELAKTKNVASRVHFQVGDAERLDFRDGSFAAVVCECAFCTFPEKPAAAREFARVLRPGGQVGISDITRAPVLPKNLESLLAWVACIADAQSLETYQEYLSRAGLNAKVVENHDEALHEMVQQVRRKLLGAELLVGLQKLALPKVDLQAAKEMAGSAQQAVQQGLLGYVLITSVKPAKR